MRVYEKDGKKYISVTSIIDLMFSFDNTGFEIWANKNHLNPKWVTKHSSDIGTLYHSYFENKYHNIDSWANVVPEGSEGFVEAVNDFYKKGWEIISSEQEVYCDEFGYAGRFDCLVKNERLGIKEALGDIKTWGAWNKKLYKPNAKKLEKLSNQESMYRYALKKEIPMYIIVPQFNGSCVVEAIPYTEDWMKFLENNTQEIADIITKFNA